MTENYNSCSIEVPLSLFFFQHFTSPFLCLNPSFVKEDIFCSFDGVHGHPGRICLPISCRSRPFREPGVLLLIKYVSQNVRGFSPHSKCSAMTFYNDNCSYSLSEREPSWSIAAFFYPKDCFYTCLSTREQISFCHL